MMISLDDKRLIYSGRIDSRDAKRPEFVFPATSLHFRFYGKKAVLIPIWCCEERAAAEKDREDMGACSRNMIWEEEKK